jgi:hypothetical protein
MKVLGLGNVALNQRPQIRLLGFWRHTQIIKPTPARARFLFWYQPA